MFCLFAPLFDRLRTERHWQSGGHQQASEAIWAFAGTRNWRSTTVKCQEFTMVREKARGERVATKRARCEARARQRPKAGEKGGEVKGVAEQEISAATTTYGSVAGTLDERSRSIELPGSPSLCLSLSRSLSLFDPLLFHSLPFHSRGSFAPLSLPLLHSLLQRERSDEWMGRSDKCWLASMEPVEPRVSEIAGQHAPRCQSHSTGDGHDRDGWSRIRQIARRLLFIFVWTLNTLGLEDVFLA